jgi:apolipoprotein N-acyltransferase
VHSVNGFISTRNQLLIALGVGLLWAAAFPRIGWSGFAWLVPGLILVTALGPANGAGWRVGYLAGVAYGLGSLSWLLQIPFPAGAVAGWIALSLYVGCFSAAWVWFCGVTLRWLAPPGELGSDGWTGWSPSFNRLLAGAWWRRASWALLTAVYWVALEMTIARLFSGFPWNLLGVSQHGVLPLIQVAAWTGVYGVSFLIVWFSVALALAGLGLMRQPKLHGTWVRELGLPLLVVVAVAVAGLGRITRAGESDRRLEVALVQPSIPQELIWDPAEDTVRFEQVIELSRRALETQPQLLVWPEAAMPPLTRAQFEILTDMVSQHRVWMIFGSDEAVPRGDDPDAEGYDLYNAAFLFAPDGRYQSSYRKQQLVIFGEYIPMERWFPFLGFLTPIEGSFAVGHGPVSFQLSEPQANVSVLICFEDVFPHLARRHVNDQTEILLNLTNNGWFGESAAQWQHAAISAFRAVENGVPMVRCTNNGLTCWIDSVGRVRQILGSEAGNVYGPGFLTASIPLRPAGDPPGPTFYRLYGDRFGWACVVLTLLMLLMTWRRAGSNPVGDGQRHREGVHPREDMVSAR